jgi:hypothetical protein
MPIMVGKCEKRRTCSYWVWLVMPAAVLLLMVAIPLTRPIHLRFGRSILSVSSGDVLKYNTAHPRGFGYSDSLITQCGRCVSETGSMW